MMFLVTVPCPKLIYTKYWARWEDWVWEFEKETGHRVRIKPENTPNRLDLSLSRCVDMAKKLRPAWWVRLDADIMPEVPLSEMFRMAMLLWDEYGAITGSPTVDYNGVCQFDRLGHQSLDPVCDGRPFECEWVGGSLVFTPQDVFDRLKPVSSYVYGRDKVVQNMYVAVQRPNTTEDYDYCERVRSYGFRVFAAPGNLVRQMRPEEYVGMPSYRKGMTKGKTETVWLEKPVGLDA